jgi:hypothetical protein
MARRWLITPINDNSAGSRRSWLTLSPAPATGAKMPPLWPCVRGEFRGPSNSGRCDSDDRWAASSDVNGVESRRGATFEINDSTGQ